jgi:hypothetical protein
MHTAIIKALEERQRQINEEGFSADNDDLWSDGELCDAAASYALEAINQNNGSFRPETWVPTNWPINWQDAWWKPSEAPQRNIIKAMALLSAEYDRLERAKAAASPAHALEYLYSTDDEWQDGSYDDLHDLIVDREREAGDIVYMGVKRHEVATSYTTDLAESVTENMQVQAEDDAGEVAEGWPYATKPQEQVLQALIDAWATAYCPPDFYTIADVQEITITERDHRLAHQESQV